MTEQRDTARAVQDEYTKGCGFKRRLGLYEQVKKNERFYLGDQWHGLKVKTIQQLRDEAYAVVGKPDELAFGDKVVAVVTDPKGRALDVIRNVKA